MFVETSRLHSKLAELLHAQGCAAPPPGHYPADWQSCINADMYRRKATRFMEGLLPVIFEEQYPTVRADEREKASYRIEAELVCCDIFKKVSEAYDERGLYRHTKPRDVADLIQADWHTICYFGGWAAHIATLPDGPGHWAPISPLRTDLG